MLFIFENGQCRTLWTDAVDLRALGPCQVARASTIDFNGDTQEWEVRRAWPETTTDDTPARHPALFSHRSREACLQWEQTHEALLLTPPA